MPACLGHLHWNDLFLLEDPCHLTPPLTVFFSQQKKFPEAVPLLEALARLSGTNPKAGIIRMLMEEMKNPGSQSLEHRLRGATRYFKHQVMRKEKELQAEATKLGNVAVHDVQTEAKVR